MSGILTCPAIRDAVHGGDIEISPFDEEFLNPASYDLRLGDKILCYSIWPEVLDTRLKPATIKVPQEDEGIHYEGNGWILQPGVGYLAHTVETVYSNRYVGCVDGKSTLGRLFISVHSTAGYIDPGFRGQITLEVTVTHPVRVYPGMRFAQIRFHELSGRIEQYKGHYVGEQAKGAVPADVSGLER